jgi:membrane associated rhomboid family serine protease
VTVGLILACAAVWLLFQQSQEDRRTDVNGISLPGSLAFNLEWAAVPCEVMVRQPLDVEEVVRTFAQGDSEACQEDSTTRELFPDKAIWLSIVISMFLHGSFVHLAGNLLFLWTFGNNVEDRLGHSAYLLFYVGGGVAATLAHVFVNADSTVPVVGASGAIAAVMGAYLVWHPNARIHTLFFITLVSIRAKWLLLFWLGMQFVTSDNSGVAWVAHVGGFAFGVVAGLLLGAGRPRRGERTVQPYWSN